MYYHSIWLFALLFTVLPTWLFWAIGVGHDGPPRWNRVRTLILLPAFLAGVMSLLLYLDKEAAREEQIAREAKLKAKE